MRKIRKISKPVMAFVKLCEGNSIEVLKALASPADTFLIEEGEGGNIVYQLLSDGVGIQTRTCVLFFAYAKVIGLEVVGTEGDEIRFIVPGVDEETDRVYIDKWIIFPFFERLRRDFMAINRGSGQSKKQKI